MEFKDTLVEAQEAHRIAEFPPADASIRTDVIADILYAAVGGNFTVTLSVAAVSVSIRTVLVDELIQLGYAVDGTTTPDSLIISW
jgi:hypothetical protein